MLVAAVFVPGVARGGEPAERGASFTVWAGAAVDRSVRPLAGAQPANDMAPMFGLTGLGNLERLAIGGAVDGTPSALGDARLSLSALGGFQPELAETRIQLLAELGGHRFSEVGGSMLTRQPGPNTWLPFVGARIGVARTLPRHGPFELGLWVFARYDLARETVAGYRLGGMVAGVAFQGGLRVESAHPWKDPSGEP